MISVFGFDEDTAKKMSLIREGTDLSGKKAAISESFADEFGYKVGDKIVFHGEQDKPVEFTVGSIEKKQGIFNMGEIAVISYEDMKELTLHLGALTDDERTIIKKGCLINYYRD